MGVGDFDQINKTKAECHYGTITENDEKINDNEEGLAKRD